MAASAVRSVFSLNVFVSIPQLLLGRFPFVHQLDVMQLEIVLRRRCKLNDRLGRHLGHVAQVESRQGVTLGQMIEGMFRDELATAEIQLDQRFHRCGSRADLVYSGIGYPLTGGQIQMGQTGQSLGDVTQCHIGNVRSGQFEYFQIAEPGLGIG